MKQPILSISHERLSAPEADWCSEDHDHSVQFYENDEYLTKILGDFVMEGIDAGETVIVVATAAHLRSLATRLAGSGAREEGYFPVDASETLQRILTGDGIDQSAFECIVGDLFSLAMQKGKPIRVFGEMVALLVERGLSNTALELEELWNKLRESRPFSLLCAYPLRNFDTHAKAEVFRQICQMHTGVIPAENYSSKAGVEERLRTIACLQQESRSLRAEVAQKEKAQAQWQASESRIRQLMDLMPNAVYTCDEHGRITYYNRRAAELWGQAPEIGSDDLKFCGSQRLQLVDGTPLPHDQTPMAKAVREGVSTRDGEIVIERPDHSRLTVSVNINPLRDDDGRVIGAINVFQDISRRKETEIELRRKEEELSNFVENASVGLHWVGPDGIIQWANKAELEMLGYAREDYVGRHIREFHADQDVLEDVLDRLAKNEKICGREARMKCKDGSIKHVAIDSSVLWDNGHFVHTQCFTRDVTSQREAEQLSSRLAAIVHSSEDAIFSLSLDGVITSWNKGAERLYGYSAMEIIGQRIETLIPPDRLHEERGILKSIRGGERLEHFETRRQRKDGSTVDVSLTVSAIRDCNGTIIGVSKIARDVTDRKRAEFRQHALYELVASVNRAGNLSEIFDTALDAICRCQETPRAAILLAEPDGVLRFKAWRGLSDGYREAVEGHSPWRPDDSDPQPVLVTNMADTDLDAALKKVIAREGIQALAFIPIRFEQRLLGKFMLYYSQPHNFRTDEVLSAQTIASQLAFAIERKKSGELLEQLVRERTASLREAIAQMEEFSYTVSHDLRAPLRGMNAYAEALVEDFSVHLPDTAHKYLKRIKENASRLDRMILDLLTFSRLARADLKLELVDLNQLVHRIVEQYPGMQEPHVQIDIAPLPFVLGHDPSLTQAISNLLTNAVKFVAPGVKPRIRIWAEQRDHYARIWVEDNGIGIDPKVHHRLFKMFERAHPKLPYDGTGVGLAIVRKAMERIGGNAGLESDGLHGSRFWIEAKAQPLAVI